MENKEYIITWAIGHLVELFEPQDYEDRFARWSMENLPILPERFQYKAISRTEKQLSIIHKLLQPEQVDRVIIATDAGREGEVIARTIIESTGFPTDASMHRFWTSQALTPQVIRDGLKELKPATEYDRLWKAGQARQIADWLVGMNGSRAATIRMKDLFTVGRVQTAVLALLTDRKKEREAFKPEPYWLCFVHFENEKGQWRGSWFRKKTTRFEDEEKARALVAEIENASGTVTSVKTRDKKQPPPQLFSLTDLQREANSKFGFTAQHTLKIAQTLYEEKKCLSYPRTDSNVLGTKNVDMARSIVENLTGHYSAVFAGVDQGLIRKSNKRVFNDAKLTDHHALIPLLPIPGNSRPDEQLLYLLVLKRFAAVFHPDCRFQQTDIITEVSGETFRTTGKIIQDPGWKNVYKNDPESHDDKDGDKKKEEEKEGPVLPPLEEGDPAHVKQAELEKKMTSPPPEYSEALLLKDMTNPARYVSAAELKKVYRGDVGLGTQATRAQTIETLLNREYVIRKKRYLLATEKGCRLIDTLRQFAVAGILTSPEETARWERRLDLISQGKDSEASFLSEIKEFVKKTVDEFKSQTERMENGRLVFGNCPKCGGAVIEGKRGYGCANYKPEDGACRFVIWKVTSGKTLTRNIIKTLLEEKEAGPYPGFVNDNNQSMTAKMHLAESAGEWQVELTPVEIESDPDSLGICPSCGGNVVESPKAFGCENWRDQDGGCRFTIWKTIAGKSMTEEIVRTIIRDGITEEMDGFISRKGTTFSTRLKFDGETGKIVFVFSD